MSAIGEFVKKVVQGALGEILRKATGTGKRARRRKEAGTVTSGERAAPKPAQPTKRQASRKRAQRARAVTRRNKS